MKPFTAWVIVDADDKRPTPRMVDDRLPVFWMRVTANKVRREQLAGEGRVAKVVITEVE